MIVSASMLRSPTLYVLFLSLGLLLGFGSLLSYAQTPYLQRFGIKEGLPEVETDMVIFSQQGELWTTYSNKEYLSRFDGVNWTHYRLIELGMPSDLGFMGEDQDGMWWGNAVDTVKFFCYTKTGRWQKYVSSYRGKLFSSILGPKATFIDEQGYVHTYQSNKQRFVKAKKALYSLKSNEKLHSLEYAPNGKPFLITINQHSQYFIHYGENYQYRQRVELSTFTPYGANGPHLKGLEWLKEKGLFWHEGGTKRRIYVTLPNGKIGKIEKEAYINGWNGLSKSYSTNAWIVRDTTTNKAFVYKIDEKAKPQLVIDYYPNHANLTLSQDVNGHWWYSTQQGLERYDPSLTFFLASDPNMVEGLHFIQADQQGRLWFGGYTGQGGFSMFDGKTLQRIPHGAGALLILPGAYRNAKGDIFFFAQLEPGLGLIRQEKVVFPLQVSPEGSYLGYYFLPLHNGKIALGLIGNRLALARERNGTLFIERVIDQKKGLQLHKVSTIAEDRAKRLWMGRFADGLALYDPRRDTVISWTRTQYPREGIGAMSSLIDQDGTLWLGSHKGLYRLQKPHQFDPFKSKSPFGALERIRLPGNDTSAMPFFSETDRFWVAGSYEGVYLIDKTYRGKQLRIFSFRLSDKSDIERPHKILGGSSEQNTVYWDGRRYLWVGANDGVIRFDLQKLPLDTGRAQVRLNHLMLNDQAYPIVGTDLGKLPLNKRKINLSITANGNTLLQNNLTYAYQIRDAKARMVFEEKKVGGNTLLASIHLTPGRYTLTIQAYKNNVEVGTTLYSLKIPRTFWEFATNWWFLVPLVLIMLVSVFKLNQSKKKLQQASDALDSAKLRNLEDNLKAKNLSNFFNPHFINNTLNWVQSRHRKDPDTAEIIEKFAASINMIYLGAQAERTMHSLASELELVRNFVDIQMIRFDRQFVVQYELPAMESLEQHVKVPVLFLQIFVENAIEKGIFGKRRAAKHLIIRVLSEEHGYIIHIEDDGQGYAPPTIPAKLDRNGSTARMFTLIRLLNKYNPENPVEIRYETPIYQAVGPNEATPFGTRVVIHLPKYYQYVQDLGD